MNLQSASDALAAASRRKNLRNPHGFCAGKARPYHAAVTVRELLEDGSTLLSDDDGAFLFRRPRPGLLVIGISGRDVGQFGEAPFEEMEAEAARFGRLAIYLDTSATDVAGADVVTRWTGWLRQLPVWVRSLDILHGRETTGLNVAIAAHLARRPGRLTAHDDRQRFAKAVVKRRRRSPAWMSRLHRRFPPSAGSATAIATSSGRARQSSRCARSARPGCW